MSIDYSAIFDRATISLCRDMEAVFSDMVNSISEDEVEQEEKLRTVRCYRNLSMYFLTGQRAEEKIEYLKKCFEQDANEERLLESAKPRRDVLCKVCGMIMDFELKHLWHNDGLTKVMMMYECPEGHMPRRAFFHDGSEYTPKPFQCEKCSADVKEEHERKDDIVISTYHCDSCGFDGRDEMDFSTKPDPDEDANYVRDRKEYCLDERRLNDFREGHRNFNHLQSLLKEHEAEKADVHTIERMKVLKRLRVIELQTVLVQALEAIGMTKVELSNPTYDHGFKVRISMLDSDASRIDYDSKRLVSKTLQETLSDTNWRLVKTSLESTLGAISGELTGYTSDEEIRKVIEKENKANKGRKSP